MVGYMSRKEARRRPPWYVATIHKDHFIDDRVGKFCQRQRVETTDQRPAGDSSSLLRTRARGDSRVLNLAQSCGRIDDGRCLGERISTPA